MLYLCKGGETYLNYKVTLEKQFATFIFPMTSLFSLTSALFVDDVIKNRHFYVWYSKNDNLRTTNRKKVVDTSLENYYVAAFKKFEKWGFTDPSCRFFADVSTFWAEIAKMTSRDVKWHHVGFSPKSQEMFLFIILCCGENMKSFGPFKRKLQSI